MEQQIVSLDALEKSVQNGVSRIFSEHDHGKLRCHEIMRHLPRELRKDGYENVIVRNGVVIYALAFLEDMGIEQLLKSEPEITDVMGNESGDDTHMKGHTHPIIHSWCELNDIVIDYQNAINVRKRSYKILMSSVLIVKRKDELIDRVFYYPVGKEFSLFGKPFLYIPLDYITRIKV